jgi:hypothetical protein
LPKSDRERLEQAARDYAIEVDQFFALYPEVIDEKLMTALRVEAKLRLAAAPGLAPTALIRHRAGKGVQETVTLLPCLS